MDKKCRKGGILYKVTSYVAIFFVSALLLTTIIFSPIVVRSYGSWVRFEEREKVKNFFKNFYEKACSEKGNAFATGRKEPLKKPAKITLSDELRNQIRKEFNINPEDKLSDNDLLMRGALKHDNYIAYYNLEIAPQNA